MRGRQEYSFDFQCTYVDSREVKVDLVDVERDGATTDERNENIQGMVGDYTRHIHECAQTRNKSRITSSINDGDSFHTVHHGMDIKGRIA